MRIRNVQVTPFEFDFWVMIACGVITAILAAVTGWNRVGLFFLMLSVVNFVNAWRLSARMQRENSDLTGERTSATRQ